MVSARKGKGSGKGKRDPLAWKPFPKVSQLPLLTLEQTTNLNYGLSVMKCMSASGSDRTRCGGGSIFGVGRARMRGSWPCQACHPPRITAVACQYQLEFHETNNARDRRCREVHGRGL
ncbi:uncharacterized protein LOC131029692 isoform X2 [Cryptomeria japonica]|uniref:uncharacterized protein LOC131029692 isoform X2 n=1 Tax=Cryptomeria japonica TaxID=3369 RepID=UPI0027DA61EC|nr:uncharacterized protein LOC131029692 isoform X2 [Cryptomeria japonica]